MSDLDHMNPTPREKELLGHYNKAMEVIATLTKERDEALAAVGQAVKANCDAALLDRLHALELAQTSCLGERDTAIGRCKDLESGLVEAVKALECVYEWCVTDNPIDIDGDYIKACLAHAKPLISDKGVVSK